MACGLYNLLTEKCRSYLHFLTDPDSEGASSLAASASYTFGRFVCKLIIVILYGFGDLFLHACEIRVLVYHCNIYVHGTRFAVSAVGALSHVGVQWSGGEYGCVKDFSAIIEQAKTCAPPREIETGSIIGGFAHEQVFALADKVVDAVKSGAIRKFVVMGGCDGRMKSRDYYTEFAKKLPKDVVILTAGCAKYKYNKLELGDIGGIPRVLDAGQCNDSYSLALIALKLKEVFGLDDINDLPIAWYEQKAVIVLLALLYLGVKNIHLGPTLPGFLSPNVAKVLVESFGIAGIGTVDEDLKLLVGETA